MLPVRTNAQYFQNQKRYKDRFPTLLIEIPTPFGMQSNKGKFLKKKLSRRALSHLKINDVPNSKKNQHTERVLSEKYFSEVKQSLIR